MEEDLLPDLPMQQVQAMFQERMKSLMMQVHVFVGLELGFGENQVSHDVG